MCLGSVYRFPEKMFTTLEFFMNFGPVKGYEIVGYTGDED